MPSRLAAIAHTLLIAALCWGALVPCGVYLAEGDADCTTATSLPGDAEEAVPDADCLVGCLTCCVGFVVPAPLPLSITEAPARVRPAALPADPAGAPWPVWHPPRA